MQATLSEPHAMACGELCCVGKTQNMSPKIICSLEFSLLTFFVSRQRTEERSDELDEVKVRALLWR